MRNRKSIHRALAVLVLAGVLALQGCALVYYQKNRSGSKIVTEAGLLGIPSEVEVNQPGGLLPLYRSVVPAEPPAAPVSIRKSHDD
jgi:hypothetical protein